MRSNGPYKCLYCKQRFHYPRRFQAHIWKVHSGLPAYRSASDQQQHDQADEDEPSTLDDDTEAAVEPHLDAEELQATIANSDAESDATDVESPVDEAAVDVDVDDIQGDASKVDTRPTTHTYLDAGRPVEDDLEEWVGPQQPWNPWRPFRDAYDFQLAH